MKVTSLARKVVRRAKKIAKRQWDNAHTKHITIDVGELFFQHNGKGEFLRYDMIVRLLSVEKYYADKDYDFDLYYRMQRARVGEDWANKAVDIFKELIKSYEQNGYDEKSEILLDKDLHLVDGSHRMALAIHNGCKTISAKVSPRQVPVYYRIEWFKINGFSEEECELMENRYKQLYNVYIRLFVCTLWHPAKPFWEDITKHLALFGKVIETRDYCFTEAEYRFYTLGIYAVDDIAKWKIEKKFSVMQADETDKYYLRIVTLYLDSPDFRLKQTNNKTLSKQGELIKGLIRKAYKDKIPNYFHDVIIHIGDNFYQNEYIYHLLTMPPIDVRSIIDDMKGYDYVITKYNVDYMPDDFPTHYPLGKDIDIVCADRENYLAIKDIVETAGKAYEKDYSVRSVLRTNDVDGEYRTLVRFEQENHLVFQFDISYRTGKTKNSFEASMVRERVAKDNFYVTSPRFEILIRLCELHDYPQKKHHATYILNHIADIEEDLCNKYLDFNWRKIVEDIQKTLPLPTKPNKQT